MQDYAGDIDIENSIKDSLRRQIVEVRKQIQEQKAKQTPQMLEQRRKADLMKAKIVISHLKLRKQYLDLKTQTEESSKQWKLEVHQAFTHVMVFFK